MHFTSQRRFRSHLSSLALQLFPALLFLVVTLGGSRAIAQTRAKTPKRVPTQDSNQTNSPALLELQKRAAALETAKNAGDPQAVTTASGALIAVALRQMAHLRLAEDAFPAAIDLYQSSLGFEDNPSTRVDLAIAYLRAKKPAEALTETAQSIQAVPDDSRAWRVQGMAYMSKQEYALAAQSLERSVALHDDLEVAYSLAISWLATHQKEKAAAVFKKMDDEAANRGAMHVLMARAYRDGGYLDDAVRELKTALQLNPKTLHAHYLLGLVYLLQEEWAPKPKIREQFLLELKLNPKDFLSTYLLGAMASNEKNFDDSDRYLKAATAIDPTWSEPWIYLGLNANNQGNTKDAEVYLRKAIQLNGSDDTRSNYFIRKAYFALGRLLSDTGQKEEARTYLQKARELQQRVQADSLTNNADTGGMGGKEAFIPSADLKPSDTVSAEFGSRDSTAELDATALSRSGLTEDEKKAALTQEKRLRTLLGASFNDLATSEAIRQRFDLALDHYGQAERWDPGTPGLARNFGVTAVKAQKYDQAIEPLSKAISANPKDNSARAMLGMSYYMTEKYKEAAATIAPLGDGALKDPGLAYAWADSLARQGDFQPATEILDKLENGSLSIDTLMLVARTWELIGNHTRAVATYHKILQASPSQPKAHYYAGISFIKADRPADAAIEFEAELALSPDDIDAKYHLGFAYLQQSHRDEAAALFQQVIAVAPDHADAQYQLGKILMDEGKVRDAIPHLEAAARLSPQADYMHYQLQAAYRMDARIQDADRELAVYKGIKAAKRERQAQGMGHD